MLHSVDNDRLRTAYQTARDALLSERVATGHWVGELASSALSTATAVSALAQLHAHQTADDQALLARHIATGLAWIVARQNGDGGWGDTDRSRSNISTTMLVQAAIHLAHQATKAGYVARHVEVLKSAERYVAAQGGIPGLRRRYGIDKTFAVPILTNCALAGLVSWREVSALPFEAACLPQSWYRFAQLPVVSYAIPALVAIGQAKFVHDPPWNPLTKLVRQVSVERSLHVLRQMQPESGGYLEATPLTSFVVMSLASIGRHDHPVSRAGLRFLLDSMRPDGSWPIDTNLATWVTTLAINALGQRDPGWDSESLRAWVLACQHRERHPFTGADPGGWGWSDRTGAVPDADDTPGALLALKVLADRRPFPQADTFSTAIASGRRWLLSLQNRDRGWPTFCRGWGKLPFDRSGSDLTAHALRALADPSTATSSERVQLQRGLEFLARTQRPDGAWLPLWFGNQHQPDEENPLYGTAKVLMAYRDLRLMESEPARRGLAYLASQQNADGGWGGGPRLERGLPQGEIRSSVEETALVVEALLAGDSTPALQVMLDQGVNWLIEAVETGEFREPSPIGFYFAKLWYYESLYPIIFTVSALGAALDRIEARHSGNRPPA